MKSYGGPTTLDKILTSEDMINQEKHFDTSCSAQLNKIDSVSQNSRVVKISTNENLSVQDTDNKTQITSRAGKKPVNYHLERSKIEKIFDK